MHNIDAEDLFTALRQLGIHEKQFKVLEEMHGGQCHVLKVECEHGERRLAVRIPIFMQADGMIEALELELQTLDVLASKGFRWAPKCHGHSLTFDNAIKLPFLVLEWKDGSRLTWNERFPQRPLRDRILAQMAEVQLTLLERTFEKGK